MFTYCFRVSFFAFFLGCIYIVSTQILNLSVALNYPLPYPFSLIPSQQQILQNTIQQQPASLLEALYPSNVITLTNKLVSIPSVTGDEDIVFQYVVKWTRYYNLHATTQIIKPLASKPDASPRRNLLITCDSNIDISTQIKVMLSTHLDTVPIPSSERKGNDYKHIYGRGSVDAKGQAAAMLMSMVTLCKQRQKRNKVALVLVCGEELGHDGMKSLHLFNFSSDLSIINGEPTENNLIRKQKGLIRAKLVANGVSAHSGYPYLGISAIHNLISVLNQLHLHYNQQKDFTDDENHQLNTLNVGEIKGGSKAVNVVSDYAEATMIWRIIENSQHIKSRVDQIISDFIHINQLASNSVVIQFESSVEPLSLYVPVKVQSVIGSNVSQVAYNTDLPYYNADCKRMVLFGAGSIHQAHTDNEFIEIKELKKLPGYYVHIANELLEAYDVHDSETPSEPRIDIKAAGEEQTVEGGQAEHDEV